MKRNVLRLAVVAALGAGALLPGLPAQAADHGDGKAACNTGEICFQEFWDGFVTSQYQRHFWYSDPNHYDDVFINTVNNPEFTLAYAIEGIWNRDTQCSVRMITVNEVTYAQYTYKTVARNDKGNYGAHANQAHARC
ncbi:hypothetical protein [Dactylosporangium sp. CA-139066]|uniref:hypothetical protein n=1 Tax=Dactylosporangium sp. CA-139066 TaxID=3239930 RepID=UPI003D8AB0A4